MKRSNMALIVSTLLLLSPKLAAQEDQLTVVVSGAGIVPLGKFAETKGTYAEATRRFGFQYGDEAGLAKYGGGIGVEVQNRVLDDQLDWVMSARVLINPTDVSKITSYFNHEYDDTLDIRFDNGLWLNIPVFTGFQYGVEIFDQWRCSAIIQGGLNLTQQASRKAYVNDVLVEEVSFRLLASFGFEAGVTIEYDKSLSLSIRYMDLGSPRYEGTRRLNETFFTTIPRREMNVDGDIRSVSMLLISVGYTL